MGWTDYLPDVGAGVDRLGETLGSLKDRLTGAGMPDPVGTGGDLLNGMNRSKRAEELYPFRGDAFRLPGGRERGDHLLGLAGGAQGRDAPNIGFSPTQSGFRGDQQGLVSMLQEQAAGRGPSAAQLQLKEALGRNVSAQQALLAGARPGQQAGAARAASQQASALGGSLASQAAQARVQEQLGAQSMLGNVLGQARGQDLQFGNLGLQTAQLGSSNELRQRQLNDQYQMELLRQEMENARLRQHGGIAGEQLRTQRYAALLGTPTTTEQLLSAGSQALPLLV